VKCSSGKWIYRTESENGFVPVLGQVQARQRLHHPQKGNGWWQCLDPQQKVSHHYSMNFEREKSVSCVVWILCGRSFIPIFTNLCHYLQIVQVIFVNNKKSIKIFDAFNFRLNKLYVKVNIGNG
jgi:hypothetical protein